MAAHTPGPWFAIPDTAPDCPDHANSGLAQVDTGRGEDWPIARLCEWHNAEAIAKLPELEAKCNHLEADNAELRRALALVNHALSVLSHYGTLEGYQGNLEDARDYARAQMAQVSMVIARND